MARTGSPRKSGQAKASLKRGGAKALARAPDPKVSKPGKTPKAGLEIDVPIGTVFVAKENPRHGQPVADLAEITATIRAHGQLQRMISYKDGKRYAVTDGARRLAGMNEAGAPIARLEVYPKDEAIKLGVAAQIERVNLHPAAEAIEFAKMLKRGMQPAEIASEFGKSERYVLQREKLAKLPAPILSALSEDKIDINTAAAYANAPADRALALWKRLGHRREYIRDVQYELKKGKVSATDPLALFVGLEAYEAAGGEVERDLFGFAEEDGEDPVANSVWLVDPGKLDKLAQDKVEALKDTYKAEGWGWVDFDAERVPYGFFKAPGAEPKTPAAREKVGVYLTLHHKTGKVIAHTNLTTHAAQEAARKVKEKASGKLKGKAEAKPDFGQRAWEELTVAASAAVGRALMADPRAAMTALLARLARDVIDGEPTYGDEALQISASPFAESIPSSIAPLKSADWADEQAVKWAGVLKGAGKDLEAHIDKLDDLERAGLLAFLVGAAFGFKQQYGKQDTDSVRQLGTLGAIAGAKASAHWAPTVPFLMAMSTPALQAACKEIGIEAPAKKGAMCEAIAAAAADKGWVPAALLELIGAGPKVKPAIAAAKSKAKGRGKARA